MIADLYEQNRASPSDISEHLETFVAICQELNAARVIELGVRDGISTSAWLYGLEQTDGRLWSVDVADPPAIDSDRWTFIKGSDTDPAVLARLPNSVDVVFIDTSHKYAQTLEELHLYFPRVGPGGRIVLHDTEVECPEHTTESGYPVKRAIELFCQVNGLVWTNQPNNNGLGIIEVT